ncbi:carbohydrate-binding module family 5 protein [Macrolepiota fuliginosa MF-IS2]|uniref:chitinase n=1 Tax=Macrolepiota fuliginosa MF-IS2 TaxID=1400762 RepID=A0A9P6C8W6_9AGAR|nr:carbohydrate-binding module family 5 protein [Macrolepiota fuliginosa MF-IS2]
MHGLLLSLAVIVTSILRAAAFDNSRYDNVINSYWGQNSYGAGHSDTANYQKTLSFYCSDNTIDVFPVAFLYVFFGPGGAPVINLANTCNPTDNITFPGTNLANCASLASDITACQAKGKIITLSLGGATGSVGFSSDSQAETFAQTIWDMFLGGSSSTRPFGSAVLDGVDLDIEGGSSDHYPAFVNRIRSLASGNSKKYYVTAAPQCVYPDGALGGVLNSANFDAIYEQNPIISHRFYNNPCGLQNFNSASNWDFGIWDNWARTISPNPNVKVYIGAPASSSAAGGGYVSPDTLSNIAVQMRKSFPSFGGVMLWDASQAYANGRYDKTIKNALVAAGGTGFTFPACSAPAWVSGNAYNGGSQVSSGGYIWEAKWWSSSQPAQNPNGDWSAVSACGGTPVPSSSSTSSTTRTTSTSSTSSTSSPSTTPGGNCGGIGAWLSTIAYNGSSRVVYNGHLWTSLWWTQGDTPGGVAGVWTDNGPCA